MNNNKTKQDDKKIIINLLLFVTVTSMYIVSVLFEVNVLDFAEVFAIEVSK